jgi:Leucine-rich repeat (LRR) protein
VTASKVTTISEQVTEYTASTSSMNEVLENNQIKVIPNPATDLVAIQLLGLANSDILIELLDLTGRKIQTSTILQGSTIAYFDTSKLYNGEYIVKISNGESLISKKLMIVK